MPILVMAIPVTPGNMEQWRQFTGELRGARFGDFRASRQHLGVRERTFLQSTPQGDLVIVTLEGDDPAGAMAAFGAGQDEFTRWFV